MPDLTLYRDDIEQLLHCVRVRHAELRRLETNLALSPGPDTVRLEELRDQLHDRLSQRLHPERPEHDSTLSLPPLPTDQETPS